ncbi:ribosomal protein L27 component of cytosolic 80S ribosome and 60S large subunit [Scenedesmus sp. NREL 46B-D3]|nr:ribosomal protein L27 component of cytosolic 80S ribosome and 60S large subunit [Scenedesmus sp. NREL 46B-D3]
MVKFLKPGKVVILLSGKYAGKKAVIVKNHDDGTSTRGYGHALVCGLAKEPRKVTKRSTAKVQARRSSVKTFTKVVNYNHIMPTRYTLDMTSRAWSQQRCWRTAARGQTQTSLCCGCCSVLQAAKGLFEEKFKSGKNRWFFTKLRF